MITITNVLLRHNYLPVPVSESLSTASRAEIATIMMNVSYYGYALSLKLYQDLTKLSSDHLIEWWREIESNLSSITGDDRKIAEFVVYKNFPAEVLEKSDAEYWIPQIMMYWGFPSEMFTQHVEPREKMTEKRNEIVLKRLERGTLAEIMISHLLSPARWKDQDFEEVVCLAQNVHFPMEKISFKENLVRLAVFFMETGRKMRISSATDVLRLGAGLSNGDVSLREKVKFISFKKPVRRWLLSLLEECSNLAEDVAARPELWKRFLYQLHPGDYRRSVPKTCEVMDRLYHDRLTTYASQVEQMLLSRDGKVLDLLSSRPGEFRRRLVHLLGLFGAPVVESFTRKSVLDRLTVAQMVGLRTFLGTVNSRSHRVFPPKGNWNRLKISGPRQVDQQYVDQLISKLGDAIKERLPKVKKLDPLTKMVKLPNNGEVGYTRGTVFLIPDEIQFIRTASYWRAKGSSVTWYDNGWNFFDSNWKSKGSICWNRPKFNQGSAVFSGDPVSTKDVLGRATQLIDLYPDKLVRDGVRYAVWNILCFSHQSFSEAEEVFAALQWGEDAQKGGLFDPSRNQLAFPLTGKQMTKFICVIDLFERKLIYIDANLKGSLSSAADNQVVLETQMPAFMEYLDSLPSIHDLFCESVDANGEGYILYSDKDVELQNVPAYVFRPENKTNSFTAVNVNVLLT